MGIGRASGLMAGVLYVTAIATYAWGQAASPPPAPVDAPSPQGAAAAPLQPMPPPNPANFTASTPTKETVDAFLRQNWGYDLNRVWQGARHPDDGSAGVEQGDGPGGGEG